MNHPPIRLPGLRACAPGVCLLALILSLSLGGEGCSNFHEVSKGVLYRSAQLSGKQLARSIDRYGIKTIINLRGADSAATWYREELATSRRLGVTHVDFPLSAVHYVPPARVDSILDLAEKAPKPILVHCMGGADRSGLFCATWEMKALGALPGQAEKQLSFIYGHIPLFHGNTWAMDSSFRDYARSLGYARVTRGKRAFWAKRP